MHAAPPCAGDTTMMRTFRLLDRLLLRVYRGCGYLAAGFLVLIGLLVLASIVSRLMSVYVAGLTAYSGYAMAASSFLALAYTFGADGHIRVELLLGHLGERARWVAELWCLSVASTVGMFLAYYLVRMVRVSYEFEERSEGADAILLWIPQSLMAAGAVVLAVCLCHQLLRTLVAGRHEPVASQAVE